MALSDGMFKVSHKRKSRMHRFEDYLENLEAFNGDMESLIANFALEEGMTMRTVREYLTTLKKAGK